MNDEDRWRVPELECTNPRLTLLATITTQPNIQKCETRNRRMKRHPPIRKNTCRNEQAQNAIYVHHHHPNPLPLHPITTPTHSKRMFANSSDSDVEKARKQSAPFTSRCANASHSRTLTSNHTSYRRQSEQKASTQFKRSKPIRTSALYRAGPLHSHLHAPHIPPFLSCSIRHTTQTSDSNPHYHTYRCANKQAQRAR